MYLTKKNRKEIAGLFNSIVLAREYWFKAVDEGRHADAEYHHIDFAMDVVEMAERFGIELSGYESTRDWLERQQG
jgi:hypothetical protein